MKCPHCDRLNELLTNPAPGMIGVCIYCGGIVAVADDLRLVKTTIEQVTETAPSSVVRRLGLVQGAVLSALGRHETRN